MLQCGHEAYRCREVEEEVRRRQSAGRIGSEILRCHNAHQPQRHLNLAFILPFDIKLALTFIYNLPRPPPDMSASLAPECNEVKESVEPSPDGIPTLTANQAIRQLLLEVV